MWTECSEMWILYLQGMWRWGESKGHLTRPQEAVHVENVKNDFNFAKFIISVLNWTGTKLANWNYVWQQLLCTHCIPYASPHPPSVVNTTKPQCNVRLHDCTLSKSPLTLIWNKGNTKHKTNNSMGSDTIKASLFLFYCDNPNYWAQSQQYLSVTQKWFCMPPQKTIIVNPGLWNVAH